MDFDRGFEERYKYDAVGAAQDDQPCAVEVEYKPRHVVEEDSVHDEDAADHDSLVGEVPYENAVDIFTTSLVEDKLHE